MKEPFYDRIRYDLYNIIAYSLGWWIVIFFGWAFFITLDIAGCAITDCDNKNGYLPWHYTNIENVQHVARQHCYPCLTI